MSRLVALLIALMLPLQLAWGAAAAHCQHETAPQVDQHLGHHEHVHKDVSKKPLDSSKLSIDTDCGVCHASGAAAVVQHTPPELALALGHGLAVRCEQLHPSAPARAPDRPQWLRLA